MPLIVPPPGMISPEVFCASGSVPGLLIRDRAKNGGGCARRSRVTPASREARSAQSHDASGLGTSPQSLCLCPGGKGQVRVRYLNSEGKTKVHGWAVSSLIDATPPSSRSGPKGGGGGGESRTRDEETAPPCQGQEGPQGCHVPQGCGPCDGTGGSKCASRALDSVCPVTAATARRPQRSYAPDNNLPRPCALCAPCAPCAFGEPWD